MVVFQPLAGRWGIR
ncbi:hypothetical protein YPPY64_1346, partial [Yersinia pestis PY-64]